MSEMKNGITRRQIERAIQETAWQWYLKGSKIQYDATNLSASVSAGCGGPCRTNFEARPEEATSHSSLYTVCSDYIWNVYRNALDYSLYGNVRNAYTMAMFLMTETPEDTALIRWCPNRYATIMDLVPEMKQSWGLTKDFRISDAKRADLKTVQEFVTNWEENLRPGDIMLATGHVELYIGGGYMLDSGGRGYDRETGEERYEAEGSVHSLHRIADVIVTGNDPHGGAFFKLGRDTSVFGRDITFFAIVRPLDALMLPGGTGDAGDDLLNPGYHVPDYGLLQLKESKKSGFDITAATRSRLQYPGMEIDRTVNITPYGSAVKGETLRYSVKITNCSSEPTYSRVRSELEGKTYDGEGYVNLVVREKVPTNTRLNRVLGKAAVSGDEITWTVDIPAGGSVELVYFVDVVGELGDEIVSEGGWVADIPSNKIVNVIGGKRLDDTRIGYFFNRCAVLLDKWEEKNGMSTELRRTDWLNAFYEKVLEIDQKFPAADEMLEALFEPFHIFIKDGFLGAENINEDVDCLRLRREVAPEYQYLKNMLIRGYYGGKQVYSDDYAGEPRIHEFRNEYLEPGDVVIGIKLSEDKKIENVNVLVHRLGDKHIGTDDVAGMHKYSDVPELNKALIYDVFFALRPRQACEDINQK